MAERDIDNFSQEQTNWHPETVGAREEPQRVLDIGSSVDLRIGSIAGETETAPFKVSSFLGQGEQGQVFLVRQESSEGNEPREMVVKISRTGDPVETGHNLREFLVQKVLTRGQTNNPVTGEPIPPVPPGIVPEFHGVTPIREKQGGPITHYAFSMEYIEGKPLADSLEGEVEHLPLALADLGQVSQALAELHRRGIAHGDVKPENILVETEPGKARKVRLIDLGLACFCTDKDEGYSPQGRRQRAMAEMLEKQQLSWDTLTPSQRAYLENPKLDVYTLGLDKVTGTLLYMAPEKIPWRGENRSSDPIRSGRESDLYSLGIVMIEKLFGQKALNTTYAHSPFEVMMTKLDEKYVKWNEIESSEMGRLHPDLIPLLRKLTALAPRQRGTAQEVANSLQKMALAMSRADQARAA